MTVRTLGTLVLILGTALLLGCADIFGPGEQPGDIRIFTLPTFGDSTVQLAAVRMAPPPEYAAWYHTVEACYGKHGNFGAVRWYLVPLPWRAGRGTTFAISVDGAIILNTLMAADSGLIKHESLHDILRRNGWDIMIPAGLSADSANTLVHPAPPFGVCAPLT